MALARAVRFLQGARRPPRLELAKELGVNITVDFAIDRFGYTKMQIEKLRDMDLLYPNTTYVHASHFTDEEWKLAADLGGNVSFAPQIESRWATAGRRRSPHSPMTSRSACRPMSRPRRRPTSSPSTHDLRLRSGRKHQEAWDADLDGLEASPGSSPRARCSRATLAGPRSPESPTGGGR